MTKTTPPVVLSHNGVNVYHVYKQRMALIYWYTTDPRDWYGESIDWKRENCGKPMPDWLHKSQFDVRELPGGRGDGAHETIIMAAIDAGLLPVGGGVK